MAKETQVIENLLRETLDTLKTGGAGSAIKEVDTLPDASLNKNKFFRLTSDDNVYVSELKSRTSTTTNRLPDEQQIDKAYLYETSNDIYYYKSAFTAIFADGEVSGYGWLEDLGEGNNWYFILTEDDAEHIQNNSVCYGIFSNEDGGEIDLTNKTISAPPLTSKNAYLHTLNDGAVSEVPIPATYNAPESAQIGNAKFDIDGDTLVYDGTETTITVDGNTLTVYTWQGVNDTEWYLYSTKPASEIYFKQEEFNFYSNVVFYYNDGDTLNEIWNMYIPQLNAPDSEQVGRAKIYDTVNDVYYVCTESTTIYCSDGVEVPAYLWVAENPHAVEWSNILSNVPSTCYSSMPTGVMCDEDFYYDSENERWAVAYDDMDSLSVAMMLNDALSYRYGSDDEQFEYSDLVKYQRTEVTEVWGWQPLDYQPMISLTYSELKSLRDNSQLVPGQQYRITDYETTTIQANTRSAGHQFDIIVTADDVNKLNENARAIQHIGGTYYSWVTHLLNSETQYRILSEERTYTNSSDGVCDIPSNWEGLDYYLTAYPIAGVMYVDGSEGGYLNDNKVIISTNNDTITFGDSPYNYLMDRYNEETAEGREHEYTLEQIEWFNGKYFIDEADTEQLDATYDGTYVDRDTYFDNSKLESWELKYCLDNDTDRFSWAKKYNPGLGFSAIKAYHEDSDPSSWWVYKHYPELDSDTSYCYRAVSNGKGKEFNEILDWSYSYDMWNITFNHEVPSVGERDNNNGEYIVLESTPNVDFQEDGKGVIYYMKDEWGNECPYDFKNIQFKRWEVTAYADVPALVVDGQNNVYGYYYGAKTLRGDNALSDATYGSNSDWFYTFALKDLESGDWYDYTVVNALGLKNDEGNELVCYGNKLNEAKDTYNSGKGDMLIVLNNIVFFNCYTDLSSTSYADDYSLCNSNTFGNNCLNNTFGNGSIYNTFGNYCHCHTFGNDSYSNTFGNECYGNAFGNNCQLNIFGNGYNSNRFGNSCCSNIFGNNCNSNRFENSCVNNTFGNSCNSNIFGSSCHYNTFGNYCTYTTFGNYYNSNTFGNRCGSNDFTTNYNTSSSGQLQYINVLSGYSASGAVPSGIVLGALYPQTVGLNSQNVFTVKIPLD